VVIEPLPGAAETTAPAPSVAAAPIPDASAGAGASKSVVPIGTTAGPGPTPAVVRTLDEPKAVTLPYSDKALAQLGGANTKAVVAGSKPESLSGGAAAATVAHQEPAEHRPAVKPEPVPPPKAAASRDSVQPNVAQGDLKGDADGDPDHPNWIWPAKGELIYRFGDSGKLKGVGISGKAGQPVLAAAAGKVVYSGSGLRGYGKLVIIKHSDTFLSVYAHNNEILVKEGDRVKRGQRIAEMGDTDANRVALHFEIRRFGKPVDPVAQLPGDHPS
ncbi:MAG: peptidoglycan DD-metalloendopeptidase family protein, partial [Gammaproteobacteria bacterium]